jgi:hypothetical protein
MGDRRETPEGRGKGPETHSDSTQAILNDLARGQRDMMNAIAQMAINTQMIQHSVSTMGANAAGGASGSGGHQGGGASGSSGSQGGASGHPSPIRAYTSSGRIPRPLYPQFQGGQPLGQPGQAGGQPGQGQAVPQDPFGEYRRDYLALGPEFHADMSLLDYCSIRYRNRPREAQRGNAQTQNMDFIKKVGKLNIPTFDGSSRCSAQAWVQKLDTYFKLNPMTESEAISFATLHLDGEAHEWWYHGLVTLGHNHITSYLEFTERLMERFDRRDPELHFRDLTQLRQTGSVEAFITEFQRKAVVVSDISEHRLVMLFTEALTEPLRGWVKAFKPHTLQEAIVRTRDMGDSVLKPKTFTKPFVPQRDKDQKNPQRDWKGKPKLDDDTRRELMRKKLCFSCRDPWVPGHRCMGKGQIHYIEVESGSEEEDEEIGAQADSDSEDEPTHEPERIRRNLRHRQRHNQRRRQNLVER